VRHYGTTSIVARRNLFRVQDHRRLEVYNVARQLALDVYAVASIMPSSERFELARQLRRSAVSVGSNIAEGCGRGTGPDLCNFLGIVLGSAMELEFQLDLCVGAALADAEVIEPALEKTKRVQRMLTRLIIRVRNRDSSAQA
jgi:four helix bundle protein